MGAIERWTRHRESPLASMQAAPPLFTRMVGSSTAPYRLTVPVGTRDLLGLAVRGLSGDLWRFAGAGLIASLLLLAPALALGLLADSVLPAASVGMLVQITIALIALAVVGTFLQMLRGTAMMRLEGRAIARVSAALWDRLLLLPPSFFRGFTAGDLAVRMAAIQVLRDQVSGVVASAVLSFAFLFPLLIILFVFDTALAWLILGTGVVSLAVILVFGLLQIDRNVDSMPSLDVSPANCSNT